MVATCIFEGKRCTGGDLSLTEVIPSGPFDHMKTQIFPHISLPKFLWSLMIHPSSISGEHWPPACLFHISLSPIPSHSRSHTSPSGQYFSFCNLIPSKWQLNHLGKNYILDQFFILFFVFNFLASYLPLLMWRMKLTNRGIQKFSFGHGAWLKFSMQWIRLI